MTDTDHTTLLVTGAVRHPLEMMQREGPVASLISIVEPFREVDHATVSSGDGLFRASVPLEWLREGRLRAGRLDIPGAPTRCWSVKDVVSIRFTVGAEPDSVAARSGLPSGRP